MPFIKPATGRALEGFPGQVASLHNYPSARSWQQIVTASRIIDFGTFVSIDPTIANTRKVVLFNGSLPLAGICFMPNGWVRSSFEGRFAYQIGEEVKFTDDMDVFARVADGVDSLPMYSQVKIHVTNPRDLGMVASADDEEAIVTNWAIDSKIIQITNRIRTVRIAHRATAAIKFEAVTAPVEPPEEPPEE